MSGDGEWRPRWLEQARGLTTVHLTGWITHEALQEHFRQSHVGLILMRGGITSYWLGNKICEYLSTSLALVNNVTGESSALVESRGLGLNVPRQDAPALAEALQTLVNSPETVRRSMLNARRTFDEEFERGKIYEKYVDYLADTLPGDSAH
jgi:glycosyltransferase involved in cell wall biosynthesis